MSSIGRAGGGAARRPNWASLIERNPAYENSRVVLVDAQTIFDILGRGPKRLEVPGLDRWNDELSWLFNSPASEVRIKMNDQIYGEVIGGNAAAKTSSDNLRIQQEFIDAYRRSGKVLLDRSEVPFFSPGRLTIYRQLRAALAATGNLGTGDLLIACDGIANRIRIITHDVRLLDGLDKGLRNKGVKSILKANGLPDDIGKIFISPTRSAL